MIKDGAHHLDLRSSNANDTPAVTAARKREKAVVKRWLQQYWKIPLPTTKQVLYSEFFQPLGRQGGMRYQHRPGIN